MDALSVRFHFTCFSVGGRRCCGYWDGGVIGGGRKGVKCTCAHSRGVEISLLIRRRFHQEIIQSNRMLVIKRRRHIYISFICDDNTQTHSGI